MTEPTAMDRFKALIHAKTHPNQNNAPQTPPSPAIEAQDNYSTGLKTPEQVDAAIAATVPPALIDTQIALNANGLTMAVSSVMVHNVTVTKQTATESRQFGLQIHGEITAEDAANIVRRAALELK